MEREIPRMPLRHNCAIFFRFQPLSLDWTPGSHLAWNRADTLFNNPSDPGLKGSQDTPCPSLFVLPGETLPSLPSRMVARGVSVTILPPPVPKDANTIARRYFVSGVVQGVGYRMFVVRSAMKHSISGYVRNRSDGRVEVMAMASPEQLPGFLAALREGPRFASVAEVTEEPAAWDDRYADDFQIESDR